MKITQHIHVAVNLSKARISMLGHEGEAWDHLFFAGRAMERGRHNLRAYQIHCLWFNLSVWKTNCTPLAHGMHVAPNAKDDRAAASAAPRQSPC